MLFQQNKYFPEEVWLSLLHPSAFLIFFWKKYLPDILDLVKIDFT